MNPRYRGPEVLPPASQVRKQVEEHLESLPGWDPEPRDRAVEPLPDPAKTRPSRA